MSIPRLLALIILCQACQGSAVQEEKEEEKPTAPVEVVEEQPAEEELPALQKFDEDAWRVQIQELDECRGPDPAPSWGNLVRGRVNFGPDGKAAEVSLLGSTVTQSIRTCVEEKLNTWSAPDSSHGGFVEFQRRFDEGNAGTQPTAALRKDKLDFSSADEGQKAVLSGKWSEAIAHCEGVENSRCYRILGLAHMKTGNTKEGCANFAKAKVKHPNCK